MAGIVDPTTCRAVIFDLDEALLDRREAWIFAVEEAVAATTGKRATARPLVDEYQRRPLRDALRVLLPDPRVHDRCEELAGTMYRRSALKRLLVHEGIGMALDSLRDAGIEIGAISRAEHGDMLKQMQSTGLDRFVAVISATRASEPWDPVARWSDCLRFLEQPVARAIFVSPVPEDLRTIAATGAVAIQAGWAGSTRGGTVEHPRGLLPAIRVATRRDP